MTEEEKQGNLENDGKDLNLSELKKIIDMQMSSFEAMNAQITSTLDGFDNKIKELSERVEQLQKNKK